MMPKYTVGDSVMVKGRTGAGLSEHIVTKVGRRWVTLALAGGFRTLEKRYDMATGQAEFPTAYGYITTVEAEEERRLVHERTQDLAQRGIRIDHRAATALGAAGLEHIQHVAGAAGVVAR